MTPVLLPLIGAAVGSAAMYLFDPEHGRRRRGLIRDQAMKATCNARDMLDAGGRDIKNRLWGTIRHAPSRFDWRQPSDDVLVERVRAKLGRHVEHPGAIEVMASHGRVMLLGSVLRHEHKQLLQAVRSVRGVKEVTDQLAVYKTAEGVSELQGGTPRPGERAELLQDNWSPGTRLIGTAAGSTLALYALRSGGVPGLLLGAAGALIVLRSTTNKPFRQLAGKTGRRAIDIQKTITIHAPLETVFEFLSDYQNFPRFMRNVRSVEPRAGGQTHWVVAGPASTEVQWDSVITQFIPNELIAWRTVKGSPIGHGGIIRFERFEDGSRVHMRMSYNPPAGALGHAVAKLLGADPKTELDEDLMRLKMTIETGHPPRDAAAAERSAPSAVPA
jgi:uncharacterized membrane protein